MDGEIQLDPLAGRILGVLVEKALTTPEQYPLSLNAVVAGANQKNNRDPILSIGEDEALAALDRLIQKELARRVFPGSSRVDKYCHTGTSTLKIDVPALATLAELFLRGPQTAAELRLRVSRMSPIDSLETMHAVLRALLERTLVRRLPAGHGSRAERYAEILTKSAGESAVASGPDAAASPCEQPIGLGLAQRVDALEADLERLRGQLHALADKLGEALD